MPHHRWQLSMAIVASFLAIPTVSVAAETPHIKAVEDSGAKVPFTMPGGVLVVKGTGFTWATMGGAASSAPTEDGTDNSGVPGQPKKPKERGPVVVRATLGKSPAIVLSSEPDAVTIVVPANTKPGKYDLQITIDGESSNKIKVEVLSMEEFDEKYRSKGSETGAVQESAYDRWKGRLKVDRFEFSEDSSGQGIIAQVEGTARLPDRTFVTLKLMLTGKSEHEARAIARRKESVKNGRFSCTFGPFGKGFLAGLYQIEAMVDLGKNPHVRKLVAKMITESEKQVVENWKKGKLLDRAFQEMGAREERVTEELAIKLHYYDALVTTRELIEQLDLAYGATAKCLFKKGSSFNRDKWLAFLRAQRLLKRDPSTGRTDERWLRRLENENRFLTKKFYFDDEMWLDWLVDAHLSEISALRREHATYKAQWVALRYPNASLKLDHMLSVLYQLSQKRSVRFYEHSDIIEIPKELRTPGEMGPFPTTPAVNNAYVRQCYAEIQRVVGLKDWTPTDPAKKSTKAEQD